MIARLNAVQELQKNPADGSAWYELKEGSFTLVAELHFMQHVEIALSVFKLNAKGSFLMTIATLRGNEITATKRYSWNRPPLNLAEPNYISIKPSPDDDINNLVYLKFPQVFECLPGTIITITQFDNAGRPTPCLQSARFYVSHIFPESPQNPKEPKEFSF